ncbi:SDR family NAD(P)-dependent oxidoreductase [Futiania mangrovi]|uniref:SDR family oxidoreductase n=1 Tax=Futiania mangrovi TaxID=2959716 RepID=A0A9J6P9H6_9PROT|nr:SDR family oxidoreductase [Futiania mangrovii]MCP1335517.1 SDR family oxidoreductase [Futiania mangrovii]
MGAGGRLAGKVALVTGAGGPMGSAIARRFAEEGAALGLVDISGTRLGAVRDDLTAAFPGARIAAVRANAVEEEEARAAASEIEAALGPVDVLVNVVGGIKGGPLAMPILGMSRERLDTTFDLNLKALFWMVQAVAPGMVARGAGSILNISSVTYAGDKDQPEYAAAKAAVSSLTRSLAMELAPAVTVNCIAPGLIQTSVIDRAAPELVRQYTERSLLKRLGKPEDIANAALFLSSSEASFITGAILPVSGGIWATL